PGVSASPWPGAWSSCTAAACRTRGTAPATSSACPPRRPSKREKPAFRRVLVDGWEAPRALRARLSDLDLPGGEARAAQVDRARLLHLALVFDVGRQGRLLAGLARASRPHAGPELETSLGRQHPVVNLAAHHLGACGGVHGRHSPSP